VSQNYKVGDAVVIVDDDPDIIGAGITGTVVEIDVECAAGLGMVVSTAEIGVIRGSYDCFARVQ